MTVDLKTDSPPCSAKNNMRFLGTSGKCVSSCNDNEVIVISDEGELKCAQRCGDDEFRQRQLLFRDLEAWVCVSECPELLFACPAAGLTNPARCVKDCEECENRPYVDERLRCVEETGYYANLG